MDFVCLVHQNYKALSEKKNEKKYRFKHSALLIVFEKYREDKQDLL